MKQFLASLAFIFLVSCVTTPAPVITNSCNPPAQTMIKSNNLAVITEKTLTEQEIIHYWLMDSEQFNNLLNNNNALIDWINKYCKG